MQLATIDITPGPFSLTQWIIRETLWVGRELGLVGGCQNPSRLESVGWPGVRVGWRLPGPLRWDEFGLHSNTFIICALSLGFSMQKLSTPLAFSLAGLGVLALIAPGMLAQTTPVESPAGGTWKTAYYKRGFVGNYQAGWAGGVGATLRNRVVMPFAGSRARVYLRTSHSADSELAKMALSKGVDEQGTTDGSSFPVTFAGAAGLLIPQKTPDSASDEVPVPITPGTWYLQSSYSSPQYLYAYERDTFFSQPGDNFTAPTLNASKKGSWPGNVTRIDVFTTDTRPIIACYGDSITAGYGSTPNTLTRYPDVLATLTNRPTLNLGFNGDALTFSGGAIYIIKSLQGVDTVVFTMGINDLITGRIKALPEYTTLMAKVAAQMKGAGFKFYVGTLSPGSGWKGYDDKPETEILRQAINNWLRTELKVDGIMDFDKALADPANPSKMKAEYQMDWLHPSDAGYQKMAEVAAVVLKAPVPQT